MKFDNKHDLIYYGECPEPTCKDNYIGEAKRRISERIKDHSGRDHKSHLLKHYIEKDLENVTSVDFRILSNGFRGNIKKRKVAEALLIREIKPTLNVQGQSFPLQLFN